MQAQNAAGAGAQATLGVTSSSQPSTLAKDQPPLHATGFIQGEHGTLIPVYQPDALSEYMSGTSPTTQQARGTLAATTSPTSTNSPNLGRSPPGLVAPYWPQGYPPPMFAYPVSHTGTNATTGAPSSTTHTVSPVATTQQQQQFIHQQIHGQPLPAHMPWGMPGANIGMTPPQIYQGAQAVNGLNAMSRAVPVPADQSTPHPNRFSQRRDSSAPHPRQHGGVRSPSSNGQMSARSLSVSGTPVYTPSRQRPAPPGFQAGYNNGKYMPDNMHTYQQHQSQWTAMLPHPH